MELTKVNINGLDIHYSVVGTGHEVVMLHGWGTNLQTFHAIQQHLSRHFKVYAFDFPGFGESDTPPEPWGVTEYTNLLASFIQSMGIDNPILIGHSFGGRVSIRYAAANPVRKMILTGSAGIKPKRSLNYYVKVYSFKTAKQLLKLPGLNRYSERILNRMRAKFGSSDYKNASGVMQQTLTKVVNEDLRHHLPHIKASTLLIWGENDTATPVADGKLMEQMIPDAGLVVLKNAGHFCYLEKGREFIVIVDHFLAKDKGGSHV
ncbi:alpha/beta hydrolase family protein [Paenibacillus naphthalenovorans]|uniref:Alpha/beta hydrolase family protein n=1 Tax=Paenibacillus naphthalenovorans TaxID=162209 RepID=A0A0U2VZ32_9BACL|nr:alpha/beta hydrolase family protein [Paenibacillus naphthalenovorans]SDI68905.1 Pimeloyl-ACP methyl ester carboxylesterase [Paenibacillus naphthalenovorans]